VLGQQAALPSISPDVNDPPGKRNVTFDQLVEALEATMLN